MYLLYKLCIVGSKVSRVDNVFSEQIICLMLINQLLVLTFTSVAYVCYF